MPEARPVLVVGTNSIHVKRVVAGLCEAGQPVVLLTAGAAQTVPWLAHPLLLEQRAVDFRLGHLGAARRVREAIARWRPRVLHVHQANSVAWHATRGAAGLGVPVVLTLWGSDVLLLPQQNLWLRLMVRHCLRRATVWTADAQELLAAARRLAGPGPLAAQVVIGVDSLPDTLAPLWPLKVPRVLSCRLHKPLYRVDAIVRAFAALASQGAPSAAGWGLDVAASGPETAALQRLAGGLGADGCVAFHGHLDTAQLLGCYQRASVYVSFPVSDGTSVSLLEAMAHGCVPVVSDLPANREWVVDGLNGFVVADASELPAALARAMALAATPQWREQMAPANLRLVQAKARFKDNIQQFLAQSARAEAATRVPQAGGGVPA